jgi:coatomer protein complex subunit epsilon
LSREPKSALNSTIEAYSQLLQGKDVSAQFDSLISEHQDQWYVQILGSFYLLKHGRVEDAIRLLQRHENSLECVLLLVQVFLSQGKLELAEKEVTNASSYAQDSIIYNFAEAYVNAAKNGESLRGSLYFFEELSHSHPTLKTLLGDLVLNLQLKQFQEADEVLRKINELGISSADLVANEYSYAQITGDSQLAKAKLDELTFLDAEHPVVVDYKEKEALFDSIVHKYKEQVN